MPTACDTRSEGSRFDEWVGPTRRVKPSRKKLIVQEMLNEFVFPREQIPDLLDDMSAEPFVRARGRARGALPLSDIGLIVSVGPGTSFG